jgi:very-short-patch-repair endonuclease
LSPSRGVEGDELFMSPSGGGWGRKDLFNFITKHLYMQQKHINHHSDNHLYNPNLRQKANNLRSSMTKAECCLWKYVLRGKTLKGYRFRRQRPILNFIADFICFELKLIIEVDGKTHHDEEVISKDRNKNKVLNEKGFTIIRFTDSDILENITSVTELLMNWIDNHKSSPLSIEKK